MKKYSCFPLLVSVCIVFAAPTAPAQFSGGDGSMEQPWQISSAAELAEMRSYRDGHFIQIDDISLAIGPLDQTWIPVGDSDEPFTGSFDGGGYLIEEMTVYDPNTNYQGLFGYLDGAVIHNVTLVDSDVQGSRFVGALAGFAEDSYVENISVSGEIRSFDNYAGGIIGAIDRSIVHYVSSSVNALGNDAVGGIIGRARYSEVRHAMSNGHMEGRQQVGGLVGGSWGFLMSDSYSHASATAENRVGGLVGALAGRVHRCFSTGPVSGEEDLVGGLIGASGTTASFAYRSFWDTDRSGQPESDGGDLLKGLSTAQMQQQETYAEYNFYSVWQMDPDNGYPSFQPLEIGSRPEAAPLSSLPGTGTEEDPYVITNAAGLKAMNEGLDAHFVLADDIDLSPSSAWNYGAGWTPVGSPDDEAAFSGSFNGNGHTITGLAINNPAVEYQGLFGFADGAHIEQVSMESVHLFGNRYSGGLAGRLDNGTVEAISVSGQIVSNEDDVGGVIGYLDESFAHRLDAEVHLFGSSNIGGVFGSARNSEVRHCWSDGIIQGASLQTARSAGGLIGNSWGLMLTDSYSHAEVHSHDRVGGLVGGLSGQVYRSYSTGRVSANDSRVGGLIGSTGTTAAAAHDSYWDIETSGITESEGGDGTVGLTTLEMTYPHQGEVYGAWDFDEVWSADPDFAVNNGYPYLRNTMQLISTSAGEDDLADDIGNPEHPVEFALSQNYPNPFNPVTQIPFTLPETADVQLQVFDVTGRLVATLASGYRPAGAHIVQFDAGGLASGLYIVRIQAVSVTADVYSECRTMLLMK
ncbi:T9SS type A sorting domain-containing protein [Balneolales bacterium ANBcel1]|nr:T9SS type A sorting domain-containing protein [Balneolales bacterium ANBcel1]